MSPHPLTNFEIKKYYQKNPKSNDVYPRNNLPKIRDGDTNTYDCNIKKYIDIL